MTKIMAEKTFKELVKDAISKIPKEPKENDSTFDKLAELILGKGLLSVNRAKFRFIEIEFYLNNVADKTSKEGYDLFAHKHDNRFKETETGGIRPHDSGVDIAIRQKKENGFFGGILIRCIKKTNDDEKPLITGPVLTMFALFSEIGDLTESAKSLRLTFDSEPLNLKIKVTRRIGLKTQHSGGQNFEKFKEVGWRYHIYEQDKDPKKETTLRFIP